MFPNVTPSAATHRSKKMLINAARPVLYPHLELHLRKLNKFYTMECIDTVFPACTRYVRAQERHLAQQGRDPTVLVCLLITFQENTGTLAAATTDELMEERAAFMKGVGKDAAATREEDEAVVVVNSPTSATDTYVSQLIGYRPEAYIWKDKSREVFFDFSQYVLKSLKQAWARREEANEQGSEEDCEACGAEEAGEELFFLDWCDPATGLPVNTERGPSNFVDADAIEQMFPYHSVLVAGPGGGCRMIQHPTFGLCVYPASAVLAFPADREDTVKHALLSLCR